MKRILFFVLPYLALPLIMAFYIIYGGSQVEDTSFLYQICMVGCGILLGGILYLMLRIASMYDPVIMVMSGIHSAIFLLLALYPQIIPVASVYEALQKAQLGLGVMVGACLVLFIESFYYIQRQKRRGYAHSTSLERSVYACKRD